MIVKTDQLHNVGQGGGSSSMRVAENHSNLAHKKKFRNLILNTSCCRNHGSKENPIEQISVNPWAIFDQPHTMRQREVYKSGYNREDDIKKCDNEKHTELRFNTKVKAKATRGHNLHTWHTRHLQGRVWQPRRCQTTHYAHPEPRVSKVLLLLCPVI